MPDPSISRQSPTAASNWQKLSCRRFPNHLGFHRLEYSFRRATLDDGHLFATLAADALPWRFRYDLYESGGVLMLSRRPLLTNRTLSAYRGNHASGRLDWSVPDKIILQKTE